MTSPSRSLLLQCLLAMDVLAGCGAGAVTADPPASPAGPGRWESGPAMPSPRAAHAIAVAGSAIHVLGGTGEGGAPVLEVLRFDGDRWTPETTLPGGGLNAPTATAIGDRIYLVGGFRTDTNVPSDRVHVYNLTTGRWSEVAPLPAPRGGHAAALLDGRLHVIGGGNDRSTLDDHSVYDPATDSWSAAAPLPRAEGSPAAVVFDARLYAIGGRSGVSDFGDVDVYDPVTNRWTPGPAIEPRGTAGAVEICDAIYLFGGESQARGRSLDEVLRLKRGAAEWEAVAPMPTARNFARAAVLGGRVYVIGGSPRPELSHSSIGSGIVERFIPDC